MTFLSYGFVDQIGLLFNFLPQGGGLASGVQFIYFLNIEVSSTVLLVYLVTTVSAYEHRREGLVPRVLHHEDCLHGIGLPQLL